MQRINSNDNLFHNGDGRSVLGTIVTAEWLNSVQEELVNVFNQLGGKQLDPAKHNQIAELLGTQLVLKANLKSPAFTGVPTAPTPTQNTNSDQIATTAFVQTEIDKKADAIAFTALHDLFIGVPIPYPLATVPAGCLAMNGQRFDKNRYPKLAQKYPSGVLPDMRGEFPRGWDNGRGVDAGRGLLSVQGDAIRNITGRFHDIVYQDLALNSVGFGAFYQDANIKNMRVGSYENGNSKSLSLPSSQQGDGIFFDASRVVPTANENRPRNIAFHYICLAA